MSNSGRHTGEQRGQTGLEVRHAEPLESYQRERLRDRVALMALSRFLDDGTAGRYIHYQAACVDAYAVADEFLRARETTRG